MVDNKIIKQVVSAISNQNGRNKQVNTLYGTVHVDSDNKKYVSLDGSNVLTAVVEGTEALEGDRVLVAIENHQAVVLANITSPASARTAKNYMDLSEEEEGLVIGALNDDNNNYNVLIKADGVYIRDGQDVMAIYGGDGTYIYADGEPAAEFTAEGIQFFTELANYARFDPTTGEFTSQALAYLHADNLDAAYASVDNLNAANAKITNLEAEDATINGTLTAHAASIGSLEAADATINGTLTAHAASIGSLEASDATINGTLTAHAASIGSLEAADATINGTLTAHSADIEALEADTATINGELTAQSARIGTIESNYVDTDTLEANYARIENGVIANATIGYADVNGLNAHYAEIDMANVNNAWIENGVVKDAAISDAQIIGVSANKLTAGTIDANEINVANLRAKNLIVEKMNGQPILGGYELVNKNSTGYSGKNPSNEGWYEYSNGTFVASTDATVNMSKAYYKDGTQVALYDQTYIDGLENNLQQQIDGAIETFTGSVVPTLVNYPAVDWTSAQMANHVGDIYYVVNAGNDYDGYSYRFAYNNSTSTYSWVLIRDSGVTAALADISDLQTFQSNTESWITETDEGLETIRTNHTSLSGVVNKTVKSSTQLWFTKANTTAPTAPTSEVTSDSTSGNAWRRVVPTYNASYPYYFYCWQYKYVDNTFGWSAVIYDQATTESEERARTGVANAATADGKAVSAQNTANANIKSSVQLWFTKANTTAPSKPTSQVTNNSATGSNSYNKWNLVVPVYNSSYPYYYYCYQQQKGDGTYQWSDVVYDQATSEAMKKAQEALPASTFTTFESTTFKNVKDTVDEQSSTITNLSSRVDTKADSSTVTTLSNTVNSVSQTATSNSSKLSQLTTTLGTNADGTTKTGDVIHRMSATEQDLSGFKTTVSQTYQTKSDMSNYSTTTQMNSAINQKASEISLNVAETYTTKEDFDNLEIGGRNLLLNTGDLTKWNKEGGVTVEWDSTVGMYVVDCTSKTQSNWGIYQDVIVEPNTEYTMSVTGQKATDVTIGFGMKFYTTSENRGWPSTDNTFTNTASRHTSTQTSGESQTICRMYLFVTCTSTSADNKGYFIHPKLEKGNKSTDWSPAPEDLENYADTAVTSFASRFSVTPEAISSEVQSTQNGETLVTRINQTADSVKIQAKHVEIDGTAIFTNNDFKTSFSNSQNAYTVLWDAGYGTDWSGGEARVCKKDPITGEVSSTTNGWVIWNGTKRTVPSLEYNPNSAIPFNIPVYFVLRLSSASSTTGTMYPVWYANSKWNYLSQGMSGSTTADWTWAEATDIVIASCVEPASEALFTDCVIYDPPWNCRQVTTYTVTASGANALASSAKGIADAAAPKTSAISRSQRIYCRATSANGKPSANTTWLSTSGTGYGNWSLKIPQLTSGTTKYPFLYTAVQTQTVSQQAAGTTCSCSEVLLDDTTTIIDGGNIITGTVTANQIAAHSISAAQLTVSDSTNLATINEKYEPTYSSGITSSWQATTSNGYITKKTASNDYIAVTDRMPSSFKTDDELYYEFYAKSASTSTINIGIWGYKNSGEYATYRGGTSHSLTTTEAFYSGTLKLDNGDVWNSNVVTYWMGIVDSSSTKVQIYIRKLIIRRKSEGKLIVDGSITADKIDASSINASKSLTIGAMSAESTKSILNHDNLFGYGSQCEALNGFENSGFEIVEEDGYKCAHASGALTTSKYFYSKIPFTPKPKETVTISAYVKIKNIVYGTTNPMCEFYIDGQTISGTWRSATVDAVYVDGVSVTPNGLRFPTYISDTNWHHIAIVGTWENFTFTNNLRPAVYLRDCTGDLYVRNVKYERGNTYTDWTPAPGDLETQWAVPSSLIANENSTHCTMSLSGNNITITRITTGSSYGCYYDMPCKPNTFYSASIRVISGSNFNINFGGDYGSGSVWSGLGVSHRRTSNGKQYAASSRATSATQTYLRIYIYSNVQNASMTFTDLTVYEGDDIGLLDRGAYNASLVATNYVTEINSDGIWVTPSGKKPSNTSTGAGATGTKIDGTGVGIYNAGVNVAQYGSSARVGSETSGHVNIASTGMQVYGSSGSTLLANIGYGSGTSSTGGTADAPYYSLGTRTGTVGNYSVAEGYNTTASGYASHAEGDSTQALQPTAHAEGEWTIASRDSSHAEGCRCEALAEYSHAQNYYTKASSPYQTTIGKYNEIDDASTYAFIIGNGSSSNRSNAFTVDWNGNVVAHGGYKVKDIYTPIVVETVTADNITINGNALYTWDKTGLSKTGYTLAGVIGFGVSNATTSGSNSSLCTVYYCRKNSASSIQMLIRNTGSASSSSANSYGNAKVKLTADLLWVATGMI